MKIIQQRRSIDGVRRQIPLQVNLFQQVLVTAQHTAHQLEYAVQYPFMPGAAAVFFIINTMIEGSMLSADVHRRVQQHLQFNHAGTFVPIPQSNGSGKIAASGITTTELGYLDNATSNIQQQINELKSRLDGMTATTYVTNALTSIVNKVFGGGTIGPDGNISWGDSRKIAVGNINVWAQASIPETPTTPTTGIVTHTGLAERDIWAK